MTNFSSFFSQAEYVEGIIHQCTSCKKAYQTVNCVYCGLCHHFPEANYAPGLPVICQSCNKTFCQIPCTGCGVSNGHANYKPGTPLKCKKCDTNIGVDGSGLCTYF